MALTPVNRQEEWYQQMINAATGKYLPSITAQDAGKVMTVESDGSWGVENIPSELPSVTSADETKVLTVDSNGDWVAGDAPSGLPSTTSASAGDVLSLNNNKEAVWATPSSGGGDVEVAHITIESGEDEQDVYVCDMTVEEIQAAQNNGKTVFCLFNDTLSVWSEVRTVQRDGQSYTVTMISFVAVLQGVDLLRLRWTKFGYRSDGSSDELVVVHNNAYTLTPAT